MLPASPPALPAALTLSCPARHAAVEVEADSEPGDGGVLVREGEHEAGLLPSRGSLAVGPETTIWLTEVNHVSRQRKVIVILPRISNARKRLLMKNVLIV